MSEIRLNKLVKKYNIGLQDLVDFLSKEGVEVELNPNAKVEETPELLAALGRTFGKDLQDKQAAEEVDIKLSKILENTAKKAKDEPEEEEIEQMITIKTNTLSSPSSKVETSPKVEATPKTEAAAKPEPSLEMEVAPKAEITEDKPDVTASTEEAAPAPAEVKIEQQEEPLPVEEVKTSVEEVKTPVEEVKEEKETFQEEEEVSAPTESTSSQSGGLKVVGKIDLSQFDKKPSNKKRERISKGKVDLAKAGQNASNNRANPSKNQQNAQNKKG